MSRKFNVGQLPTGSYSISGSFSGSFVGDGSGIQGITATAEPAGPIDSVQFNDGLNVSGSSKFTFNKVTGVATVTSSFAITASHALNGGGGSTFPFVGDAVITGSLTVSGSNSTVNLQEVQFDTNHSASDHSTGRIYWDDNNKTFTGDMQGSDVRLQIGQEEHVYAKNTSGVTINNGDAVRISGATGANVTITKAVSSIKSFKDTTEQDQILGVATEQIADNQSGYITTFGAVRDLDTSAFSEGDILYLSATTSGSYSNIRPAAPNFEARVGVVQVSNATEGVVLARPQEPTFLTDISQVTSSGVITNEKTYLVYDDSTNLISFTNEFSGSFSGSLQGNGSALTNLTLPNGTVSGSAQISELGFVTSSATSSFVLNSQTSSMSVLSSSYAVTASFALNGGGGSTDTGSLLTTASVSLNTITFTKGDGSTFPITVDTGSGGGGGVPSGTVSSSAQITELGFVTSSATSSFVLNSQTSSMSVATASYVAASNIDGTVSNALSSSHAQRSDATDTIDVTQGSANTNRYVTFTSAINSDGALLADPGILYNPFSNTLTVANITGTASLASVAESIEYSNVNNKPTLISSSAQIATDISGAFAVDSASFSTRITSNETNITSLTTATSSYVLNSQTSSMSVATASYVETAQTASYVLQAVSASYAPSADTFPFVGDAVITGSLTITGSFNAFKLNTSNVILGPDAGTSLSSGGISNVVLGSGAASNLTTGDNNVIIGTNAGDGIGTGGSNVAIGRNAGFSSVGNRSVLVGDQAGTQGGTDNVFLGYQAGAVGTGNYNVAIGMTALRGNSGGSNYNIAIGYEAGYGVGAGDENILIGMNAGRSILTGNANIIIGSGSLGASTLERQLRIGHADIIVISASLDTGDIIFNSTASADYFVGDGSELTNLTLPAGILSSSAQIATDISGAFSSDSASFSTRVTANETSITSLNSVTGSYAITGSNTFTGNQTINGNLTVYGTGSFDVIHTIYETSSIIYASGSTKFGDTMDDTHVRTGSMFITGSVTALDYTGIFNGALSSSAQIANEISGAFATDSASFSTRITGNETNISTLTAATASYILASQTSSMTVLSSSFAITASHALNAGGGTPTFIASGSTSASAAPDTGVVVEHSGSTAFSVIGNVGTLFSIDDDLNGMLFTANDISGFPVLQASASGDVFIGKSPQSLYTTTVISSTTAATTHSLCTLSTSSYDGAFFEYTAQSASNARAGNIMSTWNGTDIVYTETTTADIGRTSDLTTEVIISGSTARLVAYGPNAGYKIKTIIKAI